MASSEKPGAVPAGAPAPTRAGKARGILLKLAVAAVVLPVLGFAGYTWFTLHWSYSTGSRAGYIQKFSKRGWLCKTWEGELAIVNVPGALQQTFEFSVRDEAVAAKLNGLMGKRVSLTYEQHKGVPTSCFAETEYFVVDAVELRE